MVQIVTLWWSTQEWMLDFTYAGWKVSSCNSLAVSFNRHCRVHYKPRTPRATTQQFFCVARSFHLRRFAVLRETHHLVDLLVWELRVVFRYHHCIRCRHHYHHHHTTAMHSLFSLCMIHVQAPYDCITLACSESLYKCMLPVLCMLQTMTSWWMFVENAERGTETLFQYKEWFPACDTAAVSMQ